MDPDFQAVRGNLELRNARHYLRAEEWVVIVFFAYCIVRLTFAPSLPGTSGRWAAFPSLEILLTAVFAAGLKLTRYYEKKKKVRFATPALMILGALTLFSFDSAPGDLLYPARHVFAALVVILLLAVCFELRRARHGHPRLAFREIRKWSSLLVMICCYPLVPLILARTGTPDRDGLLSAMDRSLFFGKNPLILLEPLISKVLSEWMAFCYTAYGFLFLIVLGLLYLREDSAAFRKVAFAITLALALGYVGYTLVPARGPCFTQAFNVDVSLYYMKAIKAALMDQTRIDRDCFPSLHTGISIILGWGCWKHARPLFWGFLPILITIPFACVYLRYHYVVDVIAGALLAISVVRVTARLTSLETPQNP